MSDSGAGRVEYFRGDGGRFSCEVVEAMCVDTRDPRPGIAEVVFDNGRGKRLVGEDGAGFVGAGASAGTVAGAVVPVTCVSTAFRVGELSLET